MKTIQNMIIMTVFFCFAGAITLSAEPKIQLGILLDTSGSMDGLIDQAKTQLWKIVNEMAMAKQNGETPTLEVALYEYGQDSLPAENGYMRMVTELTTDLDAVSEALFALKTNGGYEYCGMVIDKAAKDLKWSSDNKTLKVIFIAGNEEFTQGTTDYRQSCKFAISKGIIINTIYCGDIDEGIRTDWKAGAELADGHYMNIDQNKAVVYIEAPQDKEIARLGDELNKTYIGYGTRGEEGKLMQEEQDTNAAAASPEASVQRTVTKSKKQYSNSHWDLVDAVKDGVVDMNTIDEAELPEEMKNMDEKERTAYIAEMTKKRNDIQKQIDDLSTARRKYVEAEMKNRSEESTFDSAVIEIIRDVASTKNFEYEK
ncbi:MAG: VWA domain-containing protein [Spirochaetales bacterium]|nr:VWA domain-containing protein [Spirochaetales bacterium]